MCSRAQKNGCFFVRRCTQITEQKEKQKNYSFSCAIRIEKNGLHTNFSIFRRFGFFFVYDKEWPKDASYGEGTRMSAYEDFDSSFSFSVCYKKWPYRRRKKNQNDKESKSSSQLSIFSVPVVGANAAWV